MLRLKPVTQALRSQLTRAVPRKSERVSDRRAKQGIAQRIQHQRKRAFRDVMFLVPNGELGNERSDRIENRVQGIPITGEYHPGGERSRAFLAERVEALIDNHPRVGLARARPLDRFGNAAVHRIGDRFCELALQAGCGAEMVEKICVCAVDFAGNGLQGHSLWALFEQQPPRRG